MSYLVKFRPREPFAFGTERGFKFQGVSEESTYYVKSKDFPEQTTIFGLIRYLILENKGLLKADYSYSAEEIETIGNCVGKESFSFLNAENQSFGELRSISPVFLVNDKLEYYIQNPFNNKTKCGEKGYVPMQMDVCLETSCGKIKMPKEGEYNPKHGYGYGYINVSTGEVKDPFKTIVTTGNQKTAGRMDSENQEDTFFKRELKLLEDNFSFAVFADVDELPERGICYMGSKSSAFEYEAIRKENDLTEKIKESFSAGDKWVYALSDLYCSAEGYDTFCIVESKSLRNLETNLSQGKYINKRRKSEKQFNLIKAGSVFYEKCGINLLNKGVQAAGYNVTVELGGK